MATDAVSQTFELVCHETKQHLWIGQGWKGVMDTFYYEETETMKRLKRFLIATAGKPLVLMESQQIDYDDYTEFEGTP